MPGFGIGNGAPQLGIRRIGMLTGSEDVIVLAQQFLSRIPTDLAEFVVGLGDVAFGIAHADDRMLVQGEALKFKLAHRVRDRRFRQRCRFRPISLPGFPKVILDALALSNQ